MFNFREGIMRGLCFLVTCVGDDDDDEEECKCFVWPVFQIHYLRLTTAILHHEKSRKYLLNNVLYPCVCSSCEETLKTE